MLTINSGSTSRVCNGYSRRGFLKIGGLGVGGLLLPDLLRARAGSPGKRPKSVIMICLFGGPPHTDTYDMKPDAPAEYRGELKPIRTNVPGVEISELFPLQAKMWDKLAVIRSVAAGQSDHRDQETHTGYVSGHPSFGSVISKLRGPAANGMPQFINLRPFMSGLDSAYLGAAHQPLSPSGPGVRNLVLSRDMTVQRFEDRRELLAGFDDTRREIDATGMIAAMDGYQARAFEIVTSGVVHKALDMTKETAATLERYKGIEKFLIARRLVEAGVGAVTLDIGNWDTHFDNFKYLREWLPKVDRAVSNLITDLHDRGLQDDVVTIMWGEFGRTPKINNRGGRDHWAPAMSVLIAGGGMKMGQAIGSTTSRGEVPRNRPFKVQQVLSTMYQAIGIDPATNLFDGSGRPIPLLDNREPVTELL